VNAGERARIREALLEAAGRWWGKSGEDRFSIAPRSPEPAFGTEAYAAWSREITIADRQAVLAMSDAELVVLLEDYLDWISHRGVVLVAVREVRSAFVRNEPRSRRARSNRDRAAELRAEGLTVAQIAVRMYPGVETITENHKRTVSRWLSEAREAQNP
jgi:hypothetical protein